MLRYTESHFGLMRNHESGKISADNGETYLRLPLSEKRLQELIGDIDCMWDRDYPMTDEEEASLREILQP